MSKLTFGYRSNRILQFFVAIIGIAATLAMYKSIKSTEPFEDKALEMALEEKQRGLIAFAWSDLSSPIGVPLAPGDEFYRQLSAGVSSSDEAAGVLIGRGIYNAASQFVHKSDVLAKRITHVGEHEGGYNIFAGPGNHRYGASWFENIEWCIRLRYAPGQENAFDYSIWELSGEAFATELGLPRRMYDDKYKYTDPKPWQGLLIPISTQWSGSEKYKLQTPHHRIWQIEPHSSICGVAPSSMQR
jgi:hypothetical protein